MGDRNTLLVSVYGELDLATCGQLEPITTEAEAASRTIVLDLTDCGFIDSIGLRQVLQISGEFNAAKKLDGDHPRPPAAIVSPRGSATMRLLQLTGLDKRLKLFGTVDDAIAWLDTEPRTDSRLRRVET